MPEAGSLRQRARRYLRRQQFNPDWLGAFFNPFFLARRALWQAMAEASRSMPSPLLDVGCGIKPYRALFDVAEYVGLDIDSDAARALGAADFYYDGKRFPFDSGRFRAVLCNQVLEHVFNPEAFLSEVHRVLGPGGRLLLTVPFVWDEHEQPWDYARYSTFGLRALLERAGFRVLEQQKLLADASMLFQLLVAYLFKVARTRSTAAHLALTAVVFAPISLAGWALGALLPGNPDLFLDQLVIAERVT